MIYSKLNQPGFRARTILLLGLLLGIDIFWTLLSPDSTANFLYSSLLVITTRLLSMVSILILARRSGPEEGRAWRFLFISLFFWWIADIVLRFAWILQGETPGIPSFVDFLRFAGSLAAVAMAISYPLQPRERFGRVREILDTLVIAIAVMALLWMVILLPALEIGIASPIMIYWSALPSIGGFVFLGLLVRLIMLSNSKQDSARFLLLGGAIFLQTIYDLLSGYQRMQGEFQPGGLLNLLIVIAALLVIGMSDPKLQRSDESKGRWATGATLQRWEPFLPIGLTYLVIGLFAFYWWDSGHILWLMVGAIALLAGLLVARQGVIIGQIEMRRYAALVNTTSDMAFICDRKGAFTLANPAFYQMMGFSSGEDLPPLASTLSQEDDLFNPEREIQEFSGEVEFIRSDLSRFPGILSLRSVPGSTIADSTFVGIGHDLSDIKKRETELEHALLELTAAREDLQRLNVELESKVESRTVELQMTVRDLERLNEELKELDRLKSDFVALVSHELRAPLTNIRSGIELILRAYPDLETGVSESLELVQFETKRLGSFVEAILDLSALEAGKFPLDLYPLPLCETLEQVINRFSHNAEISRVCLDIPSRIPELIADERALSSVLYHLIDNALKYAPEGEIRIEATEAAENVEIHIIDQGPGIPLEEQEMIFEQFHRLDTRDSRKVYGHGLGLHLSKRMLEAMGGGIRLKESRGPGTQFLLWLPAAK